LREKGLLKILFFSVVKRLSPSSAFHTRNAGQVSWNAKAEDDAPTLEEAAEELQDSSESDSESESTESLDILFALVAGITYDLRCILLYITRNLALNLKNRQNKKCRRHHLHYEKSSKVDESSHRGISRKM
jgi:hypothetical protein